MRLAHRGDWRAAPETTIPAFRAAMQVPGCDGVEFDVRPTTDGTAVVVHDPIELSASQARERGLPRLAEVLAAVGSLPFVDIELKQWIPAAVVEIDAARGRGNRLERAVVSSFDVRVHEKLARLRPHWQRWLNSVAFDSAVITRASDLGCTGVAAQWKSVDRDSVEAARNAGLQVCAWTVRRRPTYNRLDALGVDAICAEAAALDG
jgi:glycerophosphoryl diester phosphodiesterase